jgi:hypothetical protein
LQADKRFNDALSEAEKQEDERKGADLLESKALPAADEAIAIATAQTPESSWGKEQKDALLSVLRDRRASIPEYAKAMRGDDLEAKLHATEKQQELQKRAMDAVLRAQKAPP